MAEHPREKERAMSVSVPSFDSFRVEGEILPRRMTATEKRDFQVRSILTSTPLLSPYLAHFSLPTVLF